MRPSKNNRSDSAKGRIHDSGPIEAFLKESDELQDEIRKLSEYCETESVKNPRLLQSELKSDISYLKTINSSLEKHGFKTIPEQKPSVSTISDILIDVLTEYSSLKENLSALKSKSKSKMYSKNPSSAENPDKLRDFEQSVKSRMRKSLEYPKEPEFSDPYKLSVLDQVKTIIESHNYDSIIPDLKKIKSAMMSLPAIENFLNQICNELFPDPTISYNQDLAIMKLKSMVKIQSEFDALIEENLSLRKIVDYFSKLFQVKAHEKIMESIECVFYFVHEMKEFLDLARKSLQLSSKTQADTVIQTILHKLNN